MSKGFSFLIPICIMAARLTAQNVGIGTTEPVNKLQVHGSLVITAPTTATNTAPTVAQTKTMVNASTITFANTDSTGRIYDPGGPGGNYAANQTANTSISSAVTAAGIEITAESMDLSSGDSLIVKESLTGATLMAVGNLYTTTGKWTFNSSSLYIIFKSNADANVGAGFSLLFRRLYNTATTQSDAGGFTGNALLFDTKNGIFRSGAIKNPLQGDYSTAMGFNTVANKYAAVALGNSTNATGDYAVALGNFTTASGNSAFATGFLSNAGSDYAIAGGYLATASGDYSIAMGNIATASGFNSIALGPSAIASGGASRVFGNSAVASGPNSTAIGYLTTSGGNRSTAMGSETTANGDYSTAMGHSTLATGGYSTAVGYNTEASGNYSTAMGNSALARNMNAFSAGTNTIADGISSTALGRSARATADYSTAMGNYVNATFEGCLMIGDNSTTTFLNSATANSFRARFDGGYRFFTSAAAINAESCQLPAGGNAWVTASDYRLKEKFQQADGEDFLKSISAMKLGSWNYISQNPLKQRHYGPMAQDFYAAFGKDNYGVIGNDTTINSADFDGVNLIAIQALEKRTQKIEQLEYENTELKKMILQLRKEMDELKLKKNHK